MPTHERPVRRPADAAAILNGAGPTISVPEAGAAFGLSERTARGLVQRGEFPVRVLRIGRLVRVPTADVRRKLGLPVEPAGTEQVPA